MNLQRQIKHQVLFHFILFQTEQQKIDSGPVIKPITQNPILVTEEQQDYFQFHLLLNQSIGNYEQDELQIN